MFYDVIHRSCRRLQSNLHLPFRRSRTTAYCQSSSLVSAPLFSVVDKSEETEPKTTDHPIMSSSTIPLPFPSLTSFPVIVSDASVACQLRRPFRSMTFIDGTWLYYSTYHRLIRRDLGLTPAAITDLNFSVLSDKLVEEVQLRIKDFTDCPVDLMRTAVFASLGETLTEDRGLFFDAMRRANYDVHLYRTRKMKEKCVDIALAVDLLHFSQGPKAYDLAIPIIGDLDFQPALVRVREGGKRICIASMRRSCSRELSAYHDNVRDFEMIWIDEMMPAVLSPHADLVKEYLKSAALIKTPVLNLSSSLSSFGRSRVGSLDDSSPPTESDLARLVSALTRYFRQCPNRVTDLRGLGTFISYYDKNLYKLIVTSLGGLRKVLKSRPEFIEGSQSSSGSPSPDMSLNPIFRLASDCVYGTFTLDATTAKWQTDPNFGIPSTLVDYRREVALFLKEEQMRDGGGRDGGFGGTDGGVNSVSAAVEIRDVGRRLKQIDAVDFTCLRLAEGGLKRFLCNQNDLFAIERPLDLNPKVSLVKALPMNGSTLPGCAAPYAPHSRPINTLTGASSVASSSATGTTSTNNNNINTKNLADLLETFGSSEDDDIGGDDESDQWTSRRSFSHPNRNTPGRLGALGHSATRGPSVRNSYTRENKTEGWREKNNGLSSSKFGVGSRFPRQTSSRLPFTDSRLPSSSHGVPRVSSIRPTTDSTPRPNPSYQHSRAPLTKLSIVSSVEEPG